MRDCTHLIVHQPEEISPGVWSEAFAECDLKNDPAVRATMAAEAQQILGVVCPPNTECHYFIPDRCQDCPDYLP